MRTLRHCTILSVLTAILFVTSGDRPVSAQGGDTLQAAASLVAASEARYVAKIASGGRYMERNCVPAALPGWTGFPLQRCEYAHLGATARVTMLNPDANRLARWTVTACLDARAAQMDRCLRHIERRIWHASNAQFPVSGFVIEPRSVLGMSPPNAPLCFLFRNGVTMRTASLTTAPPAAGRCGPETAESDPATKAFRFARIASTTRKEYAVLDGTLPVGDVGDVRFLDAVRLEWQSAWRSDRNRLISASAIADRAAGKFQ
jgi:hypothetical protein